MSFVPEFVADRGTRTGRRRHVRIPARPAAAAGIARMDRDASRPSTATGDHKIRAAVERVAERGRVPQLADARGRLRDVRAAADSGDRWRRAIHAGWAGRMRCAGCRPSILHSDSHDFCQLAALSRAGDVAARRYWRPAAVVLYQVAGRPRIGRARRTSRKRDEPCRRSRSIGPVIGCGASKDATILKPTINFCWFFFKWGTVAAIIGALAAAPYLYRRLDETVRQVIESTIANHYKSTENNLQVSVHSAAITRGGIQVRGVSIVDPQADGPHAELAYLDELFLVCQTDLKTLAPRHAADHRGRRAASHDSGHASTRQHVEHQPAVSAAKVRRQASADHDRGGHARNLRPAKSTPKSLTVRDAYFKVGRFSGPQTASPVSTLLAINGYCAAESIRRVELAGTFDPARAGLRLSGIIDGLDVTPELVRDIPYECPAGLNLLETLRGQIHGKFQVRVRSRRAHALDVRHLRRVESRTFGRFAVAASSDRAQGRLSRHERRLLRSRISPPTAVRPRWRWPCVATGFTKKRR